MSSVDPTSTPAALPHRPDARTFSVEDLVQAVLSGQIRIPNFQRDLKWDADDAVDLLDSIDRGYPIGTLLLWQRPARSERLVHGSVVLDAPERSDALWVVDGQQRLTSLTRMLAGKGHPEESFAAFYDLKARRVRRLRAREAPSPQDLPLTEVLDSSRLVDWLVEHHDAGIDRQAAIGLGKRVREYHVPAYVVTTDDEGTVREIFHRANRAGKRLQDSEVFHALYSHTGPSPASLPEVARSLADLAFGPIDAETLLSMLLAARGIELTKDRVPALSPGEAHRVMTELERSARAAITFLRGDAKIPHVSLLPYQQPLFALARFFSFHPEPHPRSRELLAWWIWRGAATGAHTGVSIQTRQMLAAIDNDEHASVQRLLRTTPHASIEVLDLDHFAFSYARSKVQLLALLDLEPRDLHSGAPITPPDDALDDLDAYQRLVRTVLSHAAGHGLAGRVLHPSLPSGLRRAVVQCQDPAILASHAITPEAQLALKNDDIDTFLAVRRADLLALLESFLDGRCGWDESDTPPFDAFFLPSDEASPCS